MDRPPLAAMMYRRASSGSSIMGVPCSDLSPEPMPARPLPFARPVPLGVPPRRVSSRLVPRGGVRGKTVAYWSGLPGCLGEPRSGGGVTAREGSRGDCLSGLARSSEDAFLLTVLRLFAFAALGRADDDSGGGWCARGGWANDGLGSPVGRNGERGECCCMEGEARCECEWLEEDVDIAGDVGWEVPCAAAAMRRCSVEAASERAPRRDEDALPADCCENWPDIGDGVRLVS